MHPLRSPHHSGWSLTSCLLATHLENSSCPHLQVVVVGAHIEKSALASLVTHNLLTDNPHWDQFLPSPAGGGGGCTHQEFCIG